MPKLNKETCRKIPILCPAFEEQQKIGDYFRSLDHLITLHQRISLYFLKINTFVWEQRKLIDFVDVLDGDRGKNYPTSDDFDISGHTLFLNASNVTNDGFLFQDNQFITEEKSNSMGNGKLEEDDIVVTSRGSLGHIAWYNADISSFVPYARINSGMLILRNKKEVETEYLYHFMKSSKGQSQISFISFGSAQPQLTKKGVEDLEVILPIKRDEQVQLGHYFSNLDHLITLHHHKLFIINELKVFTVMQCKCHLLLNISNKNKKTKKEIKLMPELERVIEEKLIDQLVYGDSQWTYREDLKTEEDLSIRYRMQLKTMQFLDFKLSIMVQRIWKMRQIRVSMTMRHICYEC